jgi:hypothetical protein
MISNTTKEPEFAEQSSETGADPFKNVTDSSNTEESQQVSFSDSVLGETFDMGKSQNPVALVDGTPDITLGQFLSRPTLIASTVWNQTDAVGLKVSYDPWNLFISNTHIKKRVDNFAFIRGRLHVKVLLNSTPFWYGLGMLSYCPLQKIVTGNNPNRAATTTDAYLVAASQMPNIKLVPAKSAGGEMALPFFYHKNWLPMTASDLTNMGTLNLSVVSPLLSANGSAAINVTVQILAWMEDVELMGPTVTLAAQGKDEYGDGPISAPASAVAAFARTIKVPIIKKFARATEIGAQAVSNIARLFGYSNVPVIDEVHGFMPSVLPHLASSGIGTLVQKLTLDPKCELSIDPSLHGVPSEDPLDLSAICAKESYVGQITWATTDATDAQLLVARVQPVLSNVAAVTGATRLATTPMGYVSQFFQFWRGTIIFRFKVVCSQYHKGRIRISYDPIGRIDTNADSYNLTYTKIYDIGEDNDIEIEVPYHQATAWLEARTMTSANWTTSGALAPSLLNDNGLINIRVATTLTAPVSTASVRILMYVRGGKDFEYSTPLSDSDGGGNLISLFAAQGLTAEADPLSVGTTREVVGTPVQPDANRYLMNMGESIKSLRQVIQRHSLARSISFGSTSSAGAWASWRMKFGRMPLVNGYEPITGVNTARNQANTATVPYNWSSKHPLPYITAMFRGYRGGINHQWLVKFSVGNNDTAFGMMRYGGSRTAADNVGSWTYSVAAPTQNQTVAYLNSSYAWEGTGGQNIVALPVNNGISSLLPDFNMCNFNIFSPNILVEGSTEDFSYHNTYGAKFDYPNQASASPLTYNVIQQFVAAGVDFTPVFFLCAPTLDVYGSTPLAT